MCEAPRPHPPCVSVPALSDAPGGEAGSAQVVAAACLYLAVQASEVGRKLRDVVNVCHGSVRVPPHVRTLSPIDDDDAQGPCGACCSCLHPDAPPLAVNEVGARTRTRCLCLR
jgi:hypothetical protein